MTVDEVKKALEDAEQAYWETIDAVSAKVLTENIRPFCEQHGVRFVSGMGEWSFEGEAAKETFENPEKLWASYDPSELPKELSEILTQGLINSYNSLGSIMGDFIPHNFKK